MRQKIQNVLLILLVITGSGVRAQLLINELKVNPPGSDNPFEFIELKGTPGSSIFNTYFCVLEGDSAGAGTADLVIKLNNITLGSNGLYFIGTSIGYTINAPTIFRDTILFGIPGGYIENGSNSYLLIYSNTSINTGGDYDTNNDGVLDLPAGASVIDGVGWVASGSTGAQLYSGAVLTQSGGTPDAAVRFYGNNTPNSAAAWYCGDLTGTGSTATFDPLQISANFPAGGALSPGDHNLPNTLAVKNISNKETTTVFPNPANDQITVSSSIFPASIAIVDLTGQAVLNMVVNEPSSKLNLSNLPQGLYFLKITGKDKTQTVKFQINR